MCHPTRRCRRLGQLSLSIWFIWKEYSCNYNSRNSQGSISSCGRLGKANDENLMVDMIYHKGVTTIAIDASGTGFQLYKNGVYTSNSCSSTRLNHAVTATGYGAS